MFRFCNFGNVLSLQKLDDEDISKMEQMAKNQYTKWLSHNLSNINHMDYFGPIFQNQPEQFTFTCGDIKMIQQIAEYVRQTVQKKGYTHFQGKVANIPIQKTSQSGKRKNSSDSLSLEELEEELFGGVLHLLKPYGAIVSSLFKKDMVEVTYLNGAISGRVSCIICTELEHKEKKFYSQFWTGNKWCLSNFTNHHLRKAHPIKKDTNQAREETSLLELEIEPLIKNSTEFDMQFNNLRTQLQIHNIQMVNSAFQNKDEGTECEIQLSADKFSKIELCRIPNDGNCLFGAFVHQRFHFKVGSNEYKTKVTELRKEVVDHIRTNLVRFKQKLLGRIYDKYCADRKNSKPKTQNVGEYSETFLNNLAQECFWGGPETLQAISELFKVNVVIFNEYGEVNFGNNFDSSYEDAITLVFRVSKPNDKKENVSNAERNHYDSVAKLNNDIIDKCVSMLLINHAKSCSLTNVTGIINID